MRAVVDEDGVVAEEVPVPVVPVPVPVHLRVVVLGMEFPLIPILNRVVAVKVPPGSSLLSEAAGFLLCLEVAASLLLPLRLRTLGDCWGCPDLSN